MAQYRTTLATGFAICAAGAASAASAQSIDWLALFHNQLSSDPKVSDAARKGMRDAEDTVMHEDVAAARKDLAALAPAFDDKDERVRVAASGLFYVLSQFGEDSAEAIAPSIPTLLSLTKDSNSRLRANVFRALGYLRPKIPPEVVAAMHDFVRDPDSTARAMAMFAIARSFTPGSDDEKLLEKLLADSQPLIRKTAVEAVGLAMAPGYTYVARPPVPAMIELLRQRLSDPDTGVVRSTVRAIDEIGPPAISAKDDLQKIVDANVDADLTRAAEGAIHRITAPPPAR
jgi:HEAT repeat protein